MRVQRVGGCAVLLWKGIAVRRKARAVPLGPQYVRESVESVGELKKQRSASASGDVGRDACPER